MKFFKKKDKQKSGGSPSYNDDVADQQYHAYSSPTGPKFTSPSRAGAGSEENWPSGQQQQTLSPYSNGGGSGGGIGTRRTHRGLKGFGSFGGGRDDDTMGGGFAKGGTFGLRQKPTAASARLLSQMPDALLARIFSFVCPHSQDRSYEKCEDCSFDHTCMLCDMRDVAHCVQVCRRWKPAAERVLYTSIRIDSVHYCDREAILAEKRKRRSFFDRNAEPEDTADARLKLLCRSLRDDRTRRLGPLVQYLKIPYMLRESQHADIARTISVLPNLRYVDLPEGLYMDDPIYMTLKLEIQAKCADLRKMTYIGNGSERSLEALAAGSLWRNLEVLELVKVGMDPAMMRHVLGGLTNLRALKVAEAAAGPHVFSDDVFVSASNFADDGGYMPDIPPLEEIVLTDTPRVTADGLADYLSRPEVRQTLKVLNLNGTGVKPWSLQALLTRAPVLRHLTIVDDVTVSLPIAAGTKDIQPLFSNSLQTLNYEIKSGSGISPYAGVTRSYYNYLSGSILSGGLPNLSAVYVRDDQFPDSLVGLGLLPPSMPGAGGGGGNGRPMSSSSNASLTPQGFLSPQSPGGQVPSMQRLQANRQSHNPFDKSSSTSPPNQLQLQPPKPWAAGHNPRFSSNNPFAGMISEQKIRTLEVFTKGDDDLDWSSIVVNSDADVPAQGSSSRPVSSYGLGGDLGSVGARKSVLVNTGTGGFLAVPDFGPGGGTPGGGVRSGSHGQQDSVDEWPRPKSSAGEKKSERMDLWR